MYVMPHSPGNTARDFRLSFYTAIAAGANMQFSGDVSGTVTLGGDLADFAQVVVSGDLSGTLDIGGDSYGTVLISGSVTGAGDRMCTPAPASTEISPGSAGVLRPCRAAAPSCRPGNS